MILHSQIIGQGCPFVILHGFLGMGDNWKTLGNRFSKQGYQIHLIDQRNHGRSFHHKNFNYTVMVEDLKAYCDYYQLKKMVLLGHSMGGKTAMFFANTFPDCVEKLIVADISPKHYPPHHQYILKALSELDKKLQNNEISSRKKADEVLSNYIDSYAIRQFLLKNLYWKEKGSLGLRINLSVLVKNIEEIGKSLPEHAFFSGETLFLKGAKSTYIEWNDESLIKKHFPKAVIKTIENAGHWLHAENPNQFYEEIMVFLSEKMTG